MWRRRLQALTIAKDCGIRLKYPASSEFSLDARVRQRFERMLNVNKVMRDDFPERVKQRLAARAGYLCSNPGGRAPTSGPQLLEEKAVNVGVAAHISSAAPGGPRYNSALPSSQRAGIRNGIWLCQTCSALIDADERRYSVTILSRWTDGVEHESH